MGKRLSFQPASAMLAGFLSFGAEIMFWLCHRKRLMSALTDLQAAVTKLQGDVSTKLTAKDAQIADLTAQLALAQAAGNDGPDLVNLTTQVNAIDATVSPAP